MVTRLPRSASICILAAIAGCSGSSYDGPPLYPATAVVTRDGKPFAGANVGLIPDDEAAPRGYGQTDDAGRVEFKTGMQPGVVAGRHLVVVSLPTDPSQYSTGKRPKATLPPEMTDPAKSTKEITVTEDGPNEFQISY